MRKSLVTIICLLLITTFITMSSLAESNQKTILANNNILDNLANNTLNASTQPQGKKQQAINTAMERAKGATSLLKEINSGLYPIPKYMFANAKVMAIVSSNPRVGDPANDAAGSGVVIGRDPKTKRWSAPIFITIKDGYIRDQTDPTKINNLFENKDSTMIFFGMHDNAKNLFCQEKLEVGNLAGVLVSSGIFQYRKHVADSAAISVGLFGYVYSQKLIIGMSIEESIFKQDKVLNDAIYETPILEQFLPEAEYIPKPVLTCTDMLNQLYPARR